MSDNSNDFPKKSRRLTAYASGTQKISRIPVEIVAVTAVSARASRISISLSILIIFRGSSLKSRVTTGNRTNKTKDSTLVVVGPGFTKEHFLKHGKEKEPQLFGKCIVHGTGNSGMNGVQEAIKTGVIEQITKENRVVFETNLIEKLFEEIKKDGLATYGEQEVKHALLNGAVERLLITDVLVRNKTGEELLKLAKQNNSEFTIINTMHEAGKKIEGIGGVGALLRYKI